MIRKISCACAASMATLALTAAPAAATPIPAEFQPGTVLVGFAKGVPAARRHALEARVGLRSARTLGTAPLPAGAPPAPVVARTSAAGTMQAVRALRGAHGVRYAEPDYLMQESAAPNDPGFGLQWGDRNAGQSVNGVTGTRGADDAATAAWDVTTGSRNIVIGETDSGVQYDHPDLAANIWSNPGGIGSCAAGTHGYNVITSVCDPMDDETKYGGHGTHVAGILGAVGNNGIGVAGLNWQTTILPVKWLDANGSGPTSRLIAALDWLIAAKRAGVNVGVINDSATFVGTAFSQALSDKIDELGANGILFVTAAGNTHQNNDDPSVGRYPCRYDRPTEICVTASDQQDRLASFANYGAQTVDLAAPGDNIYSTLRGSGYGYISGGSMASPQVAGTAALMLSQQSMTPAQIKARIVASVDQLPSLQGKVRSGGRLDVCKAVLGCPATSTPTPTPVPTSTSTAPPAPVAPALPAPPPPPPAASAPAPYRVAVHARSRLRLPRDTIRVVTSAPRVRLTWSSAHRRHGKGKVRLRGRRGQMRTFLVTLSAPPGRIHLVVTASSPRRARPAGRRALDRRVLRPRTARVRPHLR